MTSLLLCIPMGRAFWNSDLKNTIHRKLQCLLRKSSQLSFADMLSYCWRWENSFSRLPVLRAIMALSCIKWLSFKKKKQNPNVVSNSIIKAQKTEKFSKKRNIFYIYITSFKDLYSKTIYYLIKNILRHY